jgi:regulator of protease activity HflC (stomatin/prohibitin superfamily)
VIFDRFRGVQQTIIGEGTHFLIPWVQRPIIFDIRAKPRNIPVATGSKGLHSFVIFYDTTCSYMNLLCMSLLSCFNNLYF